MSQQPVGELRNQTAVVVNRKIRNATPFIVGLAIIVAIVSLVFSVTSSYYFNKSDKYQLKTDIDSAEKAALGAASAAIITLLLTIFALCFAVYTHAGSKPLYWVGAFAIVFLIGQVVASGKLDTELKARVSNPDLSTSEQSTPTAMYWMLALSVLNLILLLALFLVSFNQSQNMRRVMGIVASPCTPCNPILST